MSAAPAEGDEPETAADIGAMYDDWVVDGAYERDVAAWGYDLPERAAALLVDRSSPVGPGGLTVLDAGCGTGLVGLALRQLGVRRLVGADVSLAALERARRSGSYRAVVRVDLEGRLPFADGAVDAVVNVGVLEYLSDPAATVREFVRVVAPGGTVVVTHRSDLWDADDLDGVLDDLRAAGSAVPSVERLGAYLPGHEDFGEEIDGVIAVLTRT